MPDTTSIGNDSSSLVPKGQSGFSTQGQISWTGLANSLFNVTVGVLSRLSAAGVDPYTAVVGQKLGGQFQLTTTGRQRIADALNKLQSFQAIGAALWFGFGVNHVVRIMGKTEEGQLCLALCTSLLECYDITVAAEVLVEMVRSTQAPENLRPSIQQWKALLDVSAGIFSTTDFPTHAEKLMSLHPTRKGPGYDTSEGGSIYPRGRSTPDSLAKALLAIGKVSRGESDLTSVTIVGNADAGWIGAFAEWNLHLTIRIVLASTGTVLYSTNPGEENVRVLIIYEDDNDQRLSGIRTTGRTYELTDATTLVSHWSMDRIGALTAAGRVEWDSVLANVFGSEFERFFANPRAVAGAIGCFARIQRAISTAEEIISRKLREACKYYETSSYGRGFIASLVHFFPELASLRGIMEEESQQNVNKALANYDAYVSALKIACGCNLCQGKEGQREAYCLVVILEVVISISRTMSVVDMPIPLAPSRIGFEMFYVRQVNMRDQNEQDWETRLRSKELGSAFFAVDGDGFYGLLLFDVLKLFSGRLPPPSSHGDVRTSAVSANGICTYWSVLNKASGGKLSGRVTVTPGQIELNEKTYSLMIDAPGEFPHPRSALGWPESLEFSDVSALVKETTHSLQLSLEMKDADTGWAIRVGPAKSLDNYFMARGFVSCRKSQCNTVLSKAQLKDERPGYRLYELAGEKIEVFNANIVQQWILLSSKQVQGAAGFFITDECLDCCIATQLGTFQRHGGIGLIVRALEA